MGMNEFSRKVLNLQNEGYEFLEGKAGYKRETRMIKWRQDAPIASVCVITLWDDDCVTESCEPVSQYAFHAGFVQR